MFLKSFTNPHGFDLVDAVFEVSIATFSLNRSEDFDYRISEGLGDASRHTTVTSTKNLQYQMYYWKDAATRDAFGEDSSANLPMILATTNPMGEWFNVYDQELDDATYAGLTAQEAAEKHCQEIVLA